MGTLLRVAGVYLVPPTPAGFPTATLLENLAGAFLLGGAVVWLVRRHPGRPHLHLFLMTGVLGSFTTFSALAVEGSLLLGGLPEGTDPLEITPAPGVAAAYLALSLIGGPALAMAGIAVARRIPLRNTGAHPTPPGEAP